MNQQPIRCLLKRIFLFTFSILTFNASAQVIAERIIPNSVYLPGFAIEVRIKITGEPGPLHMVEIPPEEWVVKHITSEGKLDQGVITWDTHSASDDLTFRYQVIPPANAQEKGVFSGSVNGQNISGVKEMQAFQVDLTQDYRLPAVTGPHFVGTEILHWIDSSRSEGQTPDSDDKRELMVQIWYPTEDPGNTPPIACFPDLEILQPHCISRFPQIPAIYFTALCRLVANAVPMAPLSKVTLEYPVLLFSPGLYGTRNFQNYLMEELASHGYIVIGIDHTFNSVAVRFPDGRVIQGTGGSTIVHTQDVGFVLDQVERMDRGVLPSRFTARLDTARIGIMGMSLGGHVMEAAMKADLRIRAGINMDGAIDPYDIPNACLYISKSPPSNKRTMKGGGYGCKIKNTLHKDYTEHPWYWKLLGLPGRFPLDSGTDNPERVCRIINDYAIAFFDKILKGKTVPLLDGPSPDYPEVTFYSYGEPKVVGIDNWILY